MSREAAERIVRAFDHPLSERRNLRHDDIEAVARAYLSILTPGEDDERIAREIVMAWIMTVDCDGHSDEERESLVKSFAQALAAKGARQREEGVRIGATAHIHVAGTTVGKHIDECAKCGCDLRHPVHSTEWNDKRAAAIRGQK